MSSHVRGKKDVIIEFQILAFQKKNEVMKKILKEKIMVA